MMNDKIGLKIAGELVYFLFNKEKKEVYNPLFPGIPIYKFPTNCGLILTHNDLVNIIQNKIAEFDLAIAKHELNKAIEDFKDYSELF